MQIVLLAFDCRLSKVEVMAGGLIYGDLWSDRAKKFHKGGGGAVMLSTKLNIMEHYNFKQKYVEEKKLISRFMLIFLELFHMSPVLSVRVNLTCTPQY